jgi:hypothetical protein
MISISKAFLSNTTRFGVLLISRKKRNEEYGCRVPNKGWALGIF